MVVIGIPVGIFSARYRGGAGDQLGRLFALLGVSTPAFVWGVILQLVFAYFWHLFPIEGRLTQSVPPPPLVTGFITIDAILAGDGRALIDAWHHLVLPALALSAAGIGQTARLTRNSMVETYQKPFIEMARAYGFPEARIATRYAFRPALVPVLTILGLDLAALLGNAFLVEAVFGWPGLSRYGVEVILHKDLDAIVGTVLIIATAFLIANIVVDLLVAAGQPAHPLRRRAAMRLTRGPARVARVPPQPDGDDRTGPGRARGRGRPLRRLDRSLPQPRRAGRGLQRHDGRAEPPLSPSAPTRSAAIS